MLRNWSFQIVTKFITAFAVLDIAAQSNNLTKLLEQSNFLLTTQQLEKMFQFYFVFVFGFFLLQCLVESKSTLSKCKNDSDSPQWKSLSYNMEDRNLLEFEKTALFSSKKIQHCPFFFFSYIRFLYGTRCMCHKLLKV